MEILRTEHLVKTYGAGESLVTAVDDVSFSVQKGEFVAVVGASGSGKSTLLHLLGGVDRPTGGSIIVDGCDVAALTGDKAAIFRRRQVGIVYQFYNLIPILTVEENIALPCSLDGKKVDPEHINEILDSFGLTGRRHCLPNQLSGGQQQRTAIARALINSPSIVLADEPTGNLDSKASDEIMQTLWRSNRELGQTIIMITHNLEIASQADRVLTMSDGRLSEEA